jgi:hypothetical protein
MKNAFWSTTTAKAAELLGSRANLFATRFLLGYLDAGRLPSGKVFTMATSFAHSSGYKATVANVLAVVKNDPFI